MARLSHLATLLLLACGIHSSPTEKNNCQETAVDYTLNYDEVADVFAPTLNFAIPNNPYFDLSYAGLGVKKVGSPVSQSSNKYLVYGKLVKLGTLEDPAISKDYQGSDVTGFDLRGFDLRCVVAALENEKESCRVVISAVAVDGHAIDHTCTYDKNVADGNPVNCVLPAIRNVKSVSFKTFSAAGIELALLVTVMDNLQFTVRKLEC